MKLRRVIAKPVNLILPIGSKRRDIVKAKLRKTPAPALEDLSYEQWIEQKERLSLSPILKDGPQISVAVPCYNTPKKYIDELVDSLVKQSYKNWQLCLGDGSTEKSCSKNIKKAADIDNRIQYLKLAKNAGISGNTNETIKIATGDFIAFLDHDDVLASWALNEVAWAIKNNADAELFYSDEDRLSDDGKKRMFPIFKPDWSPELFLHLNYVAHFLVAKKSLVKKIKGFRSDYDGSQDYDFVLRALDYKPKIVHIPKVLYHMRMASTSTAKEVGIKNYAHDAGQRAIKDYLRRNHIDARVSDMPERPSNHRIKYLLKGKPLVSIIIPFKDKAELLEKCVSSITNKTSYKNYEIILVSNSSQEKETIKYLEKIKSDKKIKIFNYDQPFNWSAINNFGRSKAKGEVLVFLNNDTEAISASWLEEMAAVCLQPQIGCVGALLLYPDGSIQHAGVIIGMAGAAGHVFRNFRPGSITPFWIPDMPRNYLAVTGACLAVEAKKFDKVGGFVEKLIMGGSDVVLGLQLYEAGYRNVFWPYAQLIHHESKSIGSYKNFPASDYDISMKFYEPYMNYRDPYFNPNLDLVSEQIKMRSSHE